MPFEYLEARRFIQEREVVQHGNVLPPIHVHALLLEILLKHLVLILLEQDAVDLSEDYELDHHHQIREFGALLIFGAVLCFAGIVYFRQARQIIFGLPQGLQCQVLDHFRRALLDEEEAIGLHQAPWLIVQLFQFIDLSLQGRFVPLVRRDEDKLHL